MPTYEYTCDKCGHHFEKFQSMAAKPLSVCPKDVCPQKRWGRGKVKKIISGGAGLIFKGSGFYITDYRSENYKQAAKQDAPPAAKPATGAETKPAAKTEAKSENKPAKPAKTGKAE